MTHAAGLSQNDLTPRETPRWLRERTAPKQCEDTKEMCNEPNF